MAGDDSGPRLRTVRSFVRREGRLTRAQQRNLETLWERYGVAAEGGVLDLAALFGRRAPRCLEIGFGMGESLVATAAAHPELDCLGIEVHRPGVGSLLGQAHALGLTNVRVMCADAVPVLAERIGDGALDAVHIFFPDPWPKKRHHKRRLIQPVFAQLVARKLRPGGCLSVATDWEDYAQQMLAVLSGVEGLRNRAGPGQFSPRPAERLLTRFESRGRRLGHAVWDLVFERQS